MISPPIILNQFLLAGNFATNSSTRVACVSNDWDLFFLKVCIVFYLKISSIDASCIDRPIYYDEFHF